MASSCHYLGLAAGCAVLVGCAASAPVPVRTYAPLAIANSAGNFPARLLSAHNAERRAARVAALGWDPLLAAGAASYAQHLAVTGTFQHSIRRARRGVGENLWMGTRGAFSLERMIGDWASEKRWFRAGVFPHVSRTGRWDQVAHYTQIIWPTTTRVGCGLATGRGRDVLVCRYAPAGNIDGRGVP
jgi:hypothetical protein